MSSRDPTQVARLHGKHFYPMKNILELRPFFNINIIIMNTRL